MVVRRRRESRGQLESSILLVKSLLAELVKLDLTSEIATHQILHFFADRRLEEVSINPHERVHLV